MRFNIEVYLYPDETFTSWFFRTSIANGSDPKSFALSVWRQNSLWYRDLDRYIPEDLVIKLGKQSMLSYQQIENLTLSSMIKKLAPDSLANKYKWGFLLPLGQKGAVRTNGLYFCPKCLAEDNPYIKKEWKMAWCVACSTHNTQLVITCEKCNHIFSPYALSYEQTNIYLCYNCNYDLRKSKTKKADKNVIHFQNILSQIAFKSQKQQYFPLKFKNNQDLFLSLNIFLSFIAYTYNKGKYRKLLEALYIDTLHKFTKSNNTTFCRYNLVDREYLLSCAYKIFQFDIKSLITLFQNHNVSKKVLQRTYKNISPTISYILSKLPDSNILKPPRRIKTQIVPKSKEEVNILFKQVKEILQYEL